MADTPQTSNTLSTGSSYNCRTRCVYIKVPRSSNGCLTRGSKLAVSVNVHAGIASFKMRILRNHSAKRQRSSPRILKAKPRCVTPFSTPAILWGLRRIRFRVFWQHLRYTTLIYTHSLASRAYQSILSKHLT